MTFNYERTIDLSSMKHPSSDSPRKGYDTLIISHAYQILMTLTIVTGAGSGTLTLRQVDIYTHLVLRRFMIYLFVCPR